MKTKVTFVSSGTFTAPPGITSATVECWGGGGGAGNRFPSPPIGSGGGGGGGAYSAKLVTGLVAGTGYTVTVGAGGSGAGVPGGDSWFKDTATVLAKGGGGGT